MQNYKMWVGGQWVSAQSGETYGVVNPATEEEIARVPLGNKPDVDRAVEAARKAFPQWSGTAQVERSRIVNAIAGTIRGHLAELAALDTLDHGTPKRRAMASTTYAAESLEYAAQASRAVAGDAIPIGKGTAFFRRLEPVGVCGLIIPWNVPLRVMCIKLGAALAMGNTCVVKPPSIDSLVILRLGEMLEELDIPAGVINIVTGPGETVGEAIASHSGVDLISFTGSCEAGKAIMASASQTVKRLTLELGGKNPFVVLEDADVDAAVSKAVFCSYANTGMVCASPGRYYIHEKLYDEFAAKFIAGSEKIVVGDPTEESTDMGPVVSAQHRDKVEGYIKSGIEEGAKLLLGGKRPATPPLNRGYFVMPTVFGDVTQNMVIAREEIFGPVACMLRFSSEAEAVHLANDSMMGLCASVWTRSAARGLRLAEELEAGFVWINDHLITSVEQPWGGFKQSGFGNENAFAGLEEYTRLKGISIDLR